MRKKKDEVIAVYKERLINNDPTVIFEMFEMLLMKLSQVQGRIDVIESKTVNLDENDMTNMDGTPTINAKKTK